MDNRAQEELNDRRKFLASAGRLAATMPPALTLLLSTSLTSDAIAGSGSGNNGYGNGGRDGSPNGKDDKYR